MFYRKILSFTPHPTPPLKGGGDTFTYFPSPLEGEGGTQCRVRGISKICCALILAGSLLLSQPCRAIEDMMAGNIQMTVLPTNVQSGLKIPGGGRRVNLSFRNMTITDALRALASQGGFNLVIDESVEGDVSTDLNNVTIQDALNILKYKGKLAYAVKGNTLMVAAADSPKGQSFERTVSQIIPLKYANASTIANLLNNSVFAPDLFSSQSSSSSSSGSSGASSSSAPKVVPDFRTNSLIVMGTPSDIRAANEYAKALDLPRQSKTWRLSHANALDVATILSASLLNDGKPRLTVSSGGGSASSGAAGNLPASLRVRAENLKEGQGSLSQGGAAGGGGGGGGSGASGSTNAGLNTNITLRMLSKEDQTAQIYPDGPIVIPDTRMNTITLFGTAEQIAMAESFIGNLDRKAPQVVLETALIELGDIQNKNFGVNAGVTHWRFGLGVNNTQSASSSLFNNPYSKPVGIATPATNPFLGLFRYNSLPVVKTPELTYQLNALVSSQKAKILAHPTMTTLSDNEAVISIVDEIIKSVTVTLVGSGTTGGTQGTQANIGEAGIVLNILPKVGVDNTVSLRVRPTISSVKQQITDAMHNIITLVSKREALAQQVVLKDGESFVLAGLIQDTDSNQVNKIPGIGDMPIVGALARSSVRNKNRTELVVVITPHILSSEDSIPAITLNGISKQQTGFSKIKPRETLQQSAEMKNMMQQAAVNTPAPTEQNISEDAAIQAIMHKFSK